MNTPYQDSQMALKYLDFLNSPNGQIQQAVLLKSIKDSLPKDKKIKILDAGCGSGWLANELNKHYEEVYGFDASDFLIRFASTHAKDVKLRAASLEKPLPYHDKFFDVVILNMVGPDLSDLSKAFKHVAKTLKDEASVLMTIPHPDYTYPAAEWKKGFLGLFGKKPKLIKLAAPKSGQKIEREFGKNSKISSYYYTINDYEKAAKGAGLRKIKTLEITGSVDSSTFNLSYQLFRYPLLLLLEFSKG